MTAHDAGRRPRWLRRSGRTLQLVAIGVSAALVVSACGSSGSGNAGGPKLASVSVDMVFPYAAAQWYCIYDYGKSKGFFAKHGVNPAFDASPNAVSLVATGKTQIAAGAALPSVLQTASKGAAVKLIGVQEQNSPFAVISSATKPIKTPADLVGKKIGYSPATLSGLALSVMLKSNHIDSESVKIVSLQPTAYAAALKSGNIDGYVSYPSSSVPNSTKVGTKPVVMYVRNYGFNPVPADGYVASDATIKDNPAVLKGFLAGAHDTWAYMAAHPGDATQAGTVCAKQHAGVVPTLAATQLKLVLAQNKDQLSQAAFMAVDPTAFNAQIKLLEASGQLDGAKAGSTYFTNDLLPPGQ